MKTPPHGSAASVEAFRETVLHELSQPVTALQGSLEVALLRGRTAVELKKALQSAFEQANRLATLLADLRDRPLHHKTRASSAAKAKTR